LKTKTYWHIACVGISVLTAAFILDSCNSGTKTPDTAQLADTTFMRIQDDGELIAVTLNSSTSYFQYRTEQMGFEYELIHAFAESRHLKLKIVVAENQPQMLDMLREGKADVAAYPIVFNNEMREEFIYCGHEEQSYQVLVQSTNTGTPLVRDVTDLIGKDIYVRAGTPYHERILNLDNELGGGILIHALEDSSATKENLISQVAAGDIPYTITDDKTARLNRTYFWNLDVELRVSFRQRSSWIVRNDCQDLAEAINTWAIDHNGERAYRSSVKRYFEHSKREAGAGETPQIKAGHISPYDALFRKHSVALGWDWQMLASIAYQESRFNPGIVSWAGAQGLMGIMPSTAETLKIPVTEIYEPDVNIRAAAELLKRFRRGLSSFVGDSIELIKFTLASYNAGLGHVYDAIRLASKYGKDSAVWDGNVAEYILLKSEPEYYEDPVCRHGYLRGSETYAYVTDVVERYARWSSNDI
jgi:membrane-bound lytic murein transglycosylase F